MTHTRARLRRSLPLAAALWVFGAALSAQAPTAPALYQRAVDAEAAVRASAAATPGEIHHVVAAYELVVRKFPKSGLCDNALWQASGMSLFAFRQASTDADRVKGQQLLKWLTTEYPSSPFTKQAEERLQAFAASVEKTQTSAAGPAAALTRAAPALRAAKPAATATLRGITRVALPGGDRIILDVDREVAFRAERTANPDRVLIDLDGTAAGDGLTAAASALKGMLVTGIRIGSAAPGTTRVAIDLAGAPKHSVYPLYDPYRLVIDAEGPPPPSLTKSVIEEPVLNMQAPAASPAVIAPMPTPAITPPPPAKPGPSTDGAPMAPASTSPNGDYSLARQLGLGVQRIVIDAGHGGHDPGAQGNGVVEKDLVLDVALRLQQLLQGQPGIDVVLTRGTDEFIPLEERTAIANRAGADLFLSIHANASERPAARGLETYFLNFASTPEAEAVAARENAASSQSMGHLPEILKAIALNTKLAESRELAKLVQTSMVRRLKTPNMTVRDLGVKQAPFVVLIGAQMPSVLAEISFVTNRTDATALKLGATKQRIAQALYDAILKYQTSLKKVTPASQKGNRR